MDCMNDSSIVCLCIYRCESGELSAVGLGFVAKSGWVMELGLIHVWACLECVPVPVSELGLGLCLYIRVCLCVCATRLSLVG